MLLYCILLYFTQFYIHFAKVKRWFVCLSHPDKMSAPPPMESSFRRGLRDDRGSSQRHSTPGSGGETKNPSNRKDLIQVTQGQWEDLVNEILSLREDSHRREMGFRTALDGYRQRLVEKGCETTDLDLISMDLTNVSPDVDRDKGGHIKTPRNNGRARGVSTGSRAGSPRSRDVGDRSRARDRGSRGSPEVRIQSPTGATWDYGSRGRQDGHIEKGVRPEGQTGRYLDIDLGDLFRKWGTNDNPPSYRTDDQDDTLWDPAIIAGKRGNGSSGPRGPGDNYNRNPGGWSSGQSGSQHNDFSPGHGPGSKGPGGSVDTPGGGAGAPGDGRRPIYGTGHSQKDPGGSQGENPGSFSSGGGEQWLVAIPR